MGPAAYNILQAWRNHREDAEGKVGLFEGRHQDPTSIEGQWDGGDLRAYVSDRKYIGLPQVRHHSPQDHQGPGFIHRTPKVWYNTEPGRWRSPASVQTEVSREGDRDKIKLWVGGEAPNLPLFPSQGASAPEEVPQERAVQTPRNQDPIFHLPHQLDGRLPWEVPAFWIGTTSTRIRDTRAGRALPLEGVAKRTHNAMVWIHNPRPHRYRRFLWAPLNFWGNIPDARWKKPPKQKINQSGERHQSAKSAQSKDSY